MVDRRGSNDRDEPAPVAPDPRRQRDRPCLVDDREGVGPRSRQGAPLGGERPGNGGPGLGAARLRALATPRRPGPRRRGMEGVGDPPRRGPGLRPRGPGRAGPGRSAPAPRRAGPGGNRRGARRASSTTLIKAADSSGLNGDSRSRLASAAPSTNERTRQTVPSTGPASWMATMFGCRRSIALRASRRKTRSSDGETTASGRRTLRATSRQGTASQARYTTPNEPTPTFPAAGATAALAGRASTRRPSGRAGPRRSRPSRRDRPAPPGIPRIGRDIGQARARAPSAAGMTTRRGSIRAASSDGALGSDTAANSPRPGPDRRA